MAKIEIDIIDDLEMQVTLQDVFVIRRADYDEVLEKIEAIIEDYRI